MTDPITIIGTAGAIANIVDLLGKTISTLNSLHNHWKIADITVMAFKSQLAVLKHALSRIQAWADGVSSENHYELLMCVESSVTCCRFLVARIDQEVTQLQTSAKGQLDLASKVKLLFKTKDMEEVQRMIDQQTQALNLLLSVCNLDALEQKRLVRQPQVVRLFRQVQKDTASLIVHRDADSVVTASSISSSQLEVRFDFDRELFVTNVYERWFRHRFSRAGQKRNQAKVGMQPAPEASRDGGADEQNLTDAQDGSSHPLSRQTSTSSRQSSSHSLRNPLEGLSFEMKRLKGSLVALPSRTMRNFLSESDQQKKSQAIDRQIKEDRLRQRGEMRILLLGEKSRQGILQMMITTHQGRLTKAELEAFRPVVSGYLVSCARVLSEAVQIYSPMQHGDTQKHCEVIDSYIAESEPGAQLSPEFATAITAMLELEPVTAMLESGTVLPENSAYFLENASRISSPDYIPNVTDIVHTSKPTRGESEHKFRTGEYITICINDLGSQSTETMWKKFIHRFECANAIIFVVDMDCYDQILPGCAEQTRLEKTLRQFEYVVNSVWLRRSSIILLLNQVDRFKDNLNTSPLAKFFPDYTGGNDFPKAANYITRMFTQVNRAGLDIYPHLVNTTDHSTFRIVLADIQDIIMRENIALMSRMT